MNTTTQGSARILHILSSFGEGDAQARAVRLINAFGPKVQHTIVTAKPDELGAAAGISRSIRVTYPKGFPSLRGAPTPGRLQKIARALAGYDLVLTYGWGAVDAAMAHTLFGQAFGLPPLIHHENGFGPEEAKKLKRSRNFYRKLAFGRSSGLVVPSEKLEEIALEAWDQPIGRVKHIPLGIDPAPFIKKPRRDALRGVIKQPGEFWIGLRAELTPAENLKQLVQAIAPLPEEWQLVIVGDGPEHEAIRDTADALEVGHRLHLAGQAQDAARFTGLFDIVALAHENLQAPMRVIEGMAAGLPVVAFDTGDVAQMIAAENASFVVPCGDKAALAGALVRLASDPALRTQIGKANRERARGEFAEERMIGAYRRLYASAMGRESIG